MLKFTTPQVIATANHFDSGGASQINLSWHDPPATLLSSPQKHVSFLPPAPQHSSFKENVNLQNNASRQPHFAPSQQHYQGYQNNSSIRDYSNGRSDNSTSFSPSLENRNYIPRNEGNIVADGGDRTSIRLHNPPGGKSSINIFSGGFSLGNNSRSRSPHGRLLTKNTDISPKVGSNFYQLGQKYQVNMAPTEPSRIYSPNPTSVSNEISRYPSPEHYNGDPFRFQRANHFTPEPSKMKARNLSPY